MQAALTAFGWLLLLQGAGGLISSLLGWWRWTHDLLVVNLLPALRGYEVFSSIVLGVLGFVLLAVRASTNRAEEEGR
ncbi:hypothetical protein [Nonomuraea fuscirosea]|uniref:hypothetical protein n=1 Tax=Nonomuraea fuscirosea TaxID=1291556 RepID=UPI00342A67B1